MVNKFVKFLRLIYSFYIQAILFIAGFVVLNIACYRINVTAGLFVTGITLILFGIIVNYDQQQPRR